MKLLPVQTRAPAPSGRRDVIKDQINSLCCWPHPSGLWSPERRFHKCVSTHVSKANKSCLHKAKHSSLYLALSRGHTQSALREELIGEELWSQFRHYTGIPLCDCLQFCLMRLHKIQRICLISTNVVMCWVVCRFWNQKAVNTRTHKGTKARMHAHKEYTVYAMEEHTGPLGLVLMTH